MHQTDVVVIGAGVAGLAAASTLRWAGLEVVVLEAQQRIGGRILTDHNFARHPVELGAEFIHGQNVPSWDSIRTAGLSAERVFANAGAHFVWCRPELHPASALANTPAGKFLDFFSVTGLSAPRVISAWRESGGADADVATVLEAEGFFADPELRDLVEGSYQGLNAGDLNELGAFGLLEATYAGDGDDDFRINEGYDRWLDEFGGDIQVEFGAAVHELKWPPSDGIRVRTESGRSAAAKAAVITVPLAVLKNGSIKFSPGLPPGKLRALELLGAGAITKMLLKFRRPFWPSELERFSTPLLPRFGWRAGFLRPDEEPVLTIYTGGSTARRLNELGATKAVSAVLADLTRIFKLSAEPELEAARFLDWSAEPTIRMGYSFVRPGGAGARDRLASPTPPLFWAGEATNAVRPATVHGALESGVRAAREAAEWLAVGG
jgi:monoamine oxidase